MPLTSDRQGGPRKSEGLDSLDANNLLAAIREVADRRGVPARVLAVEIILAAIEVITGVEGSIGRDALLKGIRTVLNIAEADHPVDLHGHNSSPVADVHQRRGCGYDPGYCNRAKLPTLGILADGLAATGQRRQIVAASGL